MTNIHQRRDVRLVYALMQVDYIFDYLEKHSVQAGGRFGLSDCFGDDDHPTQIGLRSVHHSLCDGHCSGSSLFAGELWAEAARVCEVARGPCSKGGN